MSKLNEAAFLRSLSLDEEEIDQPHGSCPEPGILWTLMREDRNGSAMAEELRDHIAVCPSCLDLSKRLYAFHRAVQGAESRTAEESWAESRPPLNQWIDTFLEQQAQPVVQPPVLAGSHRRRRFFTLAWAAPLAAAVAVLAVIIFVQYRKANDIEGSATQVASSPARPGNTPSSTTVPTSPSPDQQLLMKKDEGGPAESSAAEAPQTITFNGGERMNLRLTSAQVQPDGSYELAGRLSPVDSKNAVLDSADVTGVFRPALPQGRLELAIDVADFRNRSYRVSATGLNGQITAVQVNNGAVPEIGQTLEIEIMRGPDLHIEP